MPDISAILSAGRVSDTILVLILAEAAVLAVALGAFVFLFVRKRLHAKERRDFAVLPPETPKSAPSAAETKQTKQAELPAEETPCSAIGMELVLGGVRRTFAPGEPFDSDGLVVRMKYLQAPYEREVKDFRVEAPALDAPGSKTVTVRCGDFVEFYRIEVSSEIK